MNLLAEVIVGDNRETLKALPSESVQTVVTSPPYWGLRDYGNNDQIGLEQTPDEFIEQLCLVFDEVWRVLKDDGTIWVNLGDSYVGGKGASGQGSPDYQAKRALSGESINKAHDQIGGKKKTRPADNMSTMRDSGLKPKDLVGIPWRFAFAMQARGWYLRQDIIWAKPNPMPESVTDRCTKSHEYIFLMSKSPKYFYDNQAIREKGEMTASDSAGSIQKDTRLTHGMGGGNSGINKAKQKLAEELLKFGYSMRNKRSVWNVTTRPYKEAHFATYPPELITPCILAGSKEGDIVLDPFSGSGTTGEVALQKGRNYIGLELNPEYAALSEKRLTEAVGMFGDVVMR
jgi:DNA modification methylase